METKLFLVTEIEGKGLGCVAKKHIKRGTLILREKPCLLLQPGLKNTNYFDDAFHGYEQMDNDQKDMFFDLANCYDGQIEVLTSYLKENPKLYAEDIAQKVIQITDTNGFHNGVFLEMSRFNHSCVSNAEQFWNEDVNARDVRAIRKINKDEEINVNYIGLINNLHRDQRRTALLQSHKFTCFCTACDLSEEQLIVQNRLCDEFRLLDEKKVIQAMMNVRHSDEEVAYLKELYKIAKELNIFRRRAILEKIVIEGFDAACQGYNTSCKICDKPNKSGNIYDSDPTEKLVEEEKKTIFWKDVCNFSKVGLEISTTVHGLNHSETANWRKRNEDPVEYHKEENKAHPHW